MFYFLYGHSLDVCELGYPGNSIIETMGLATLNEYEFTFRVFPNIEPKKGKVVNGILIYLSDEFKSKLDKDEFCPRLYTKKDVIVCCNGLIKARIYVQKFTKQIKKHPPHPKYLANLYQLYAKYGLPLNQLNDALQVDNLSIPYTINK